MKRKVVFLFSVLLSVSAFATEPNFSQKQALFVMNYAQYSAYKLKTYNNIIALEDEYKNLKDNMNLELIKDDSSITTINNLMDAIHEERKNNKNRERLKAAIERKMNNAVYDALPQASTIFLGGNVLSTVINVVQSSGMMYMNFKKYKNQLSEEYDEKMWEYQQLSQDELNFIYKELNTYSHSLIQQYDISDEWRVNEKELSKMFNFLKDTDNNRKFRNLKDLTGDRYYQHFPLFWYYLAKAALDIQNEQEALKYFNRFERENISIFRYDTIAVDAYKGKISILLKNPKKNRSEIIEKLNFIEANKTVWNDYYFCAMVFAGIGDTVHAKKLLERNINELSAQVDSDLMNKSSLIQIYTSDYDRDGGKKVKEYEPHYAYYQSAAAQRLSKSPYNTNYDGLELSRNLLQQIGNATIALASIEQQYKQDTAGLNEALYFFGNTPSQKAIENSLEDIKKIKISTLSISEKNTTITCRIPLQWMLSSSTELYAVFMDSAKELTSYKMEIDESAMKKLKKASLANCELIYTTGKLVNDWKQKGMTFVELLIYHPLYPIILLYDLDLAKTNKNIIPVALFFNEKEYKIEASTEESDSFINTIINFFKK